MTQITEDMVINEVIKRYPDTIAIFNRFRVDACCGGGQAIKVTAARDGVDVPALMVALNSTVSPKRGQ